MFLLFLKKIILIEVEVEAFGKKLKIHDLKQRVATYIKVVYQLFTEKHIH